MADKDYKDMSRFEIAEDARKNSELSAYKSLAVTYGAAMMFFFINSTFIPMVFGTLVALSGILDGATMNDGIYTFMLLSNSVLSYAFPFVFVFLMFSKLSAEAPLDLDYKKKPLELPLMFCISLGLGSTATIITNIISSIIDSLFSTGVPEDAFGNSAPQTITQFIVFLICVGVIAPICEEIIFRWFLLAPMRKYGDFAACLISALIFALYHGNLDQFPYALAVGFIYGVVACRTNKIIPTLIFHAINNICMVFIAYLPPEEAFGNKLVYDIFTTIDTVVSVAFDIIMLAGLVIFIVFIIKGVFRLHSHSRYLTNAEKAKHFILHPAVIIGVGLMLVAFAV